MQWQVEWTDRGVPSPSRWVFNDAPGPLRGVLDQVAVGPGGVLAIARWSGRLSVRGGVVRSGGGRGDLLVADVVAATASLAAMLQEAHRPVTAALVVVPGDALPVRVGRAVVLGADRLTATLDGLGTHLGRDDVADVLRRLDAARPGGGDGLPTLATLTARLSADRARGAGARSR